MTVNRTTACATTTGAALPAQPAARTRRARGALPSPVVRDLRARAGRSPRALLFGPRDLVVVTGLPGSGKSTLMRRTVRGARVDSQLTRDRWDRRMPRYLPYAVYRPLVRLAHYAGLRRALRAGGPLVVHDCGTQAWVRRWLAREARRRGASLHLLLLDVTPQQALAGQRERGRGVSRYAFRRHRAASDRLLRAVQRGRVPEGCGSAVLIDRDAVDALDRIGFAA
ncbi:AAA family ATPase [Streptomyces sp. NPDC052079]|uniref:AAA family ATPase n=1 Tax=Streptomyces sp. NPDC052079 TaxID=3155526 RepID=UPI0034192877